MTAKKRKRKSIVPDTKFDSRTNLLGVFALLLQIDQRVNPQNYVVQRRPKNHA
jgi:hypothetical protein